MKWQHNVMGWGHCNMRNYIKRSHLVGWEALTWRKEYFGLKVTKGFWFITAGKVPSWWVLGGALVTSWWVWKLRLQAILKDWWNLKTPTPDDLLHQYHSMSSRFYSLPKQHQQPGSSVQHRSLQTTTDKLELWPASTQFQTTALLYHKITRSNVIIRNSVKGLWFHLWDQFLTFDSTEQWLPLHRKLL